MKKILAVFIIFFIFISCASAPKKIVSGNMIVEVSKERQNKDTRDFSTMSVDQKLEELKMYASSDFTYQIIPGEKSGFYTFSGTLYLRSLSFDFEVKEKPEVNRNYFVTGLIIGAALAAFGFLLKQSGAFIGYDNK